MNIPLVDLKAQYRPLKEDILDRIAKALDGMWLFLGENVQAFEKEFADFCQVEHAVGVSEGTTALQLALVACGVGAGDEVITVSHTFFATVEPIVLVGAEPVFVDIDPLTYTMAVELTPHRINVNVIEPGWTDTPGERRLCPEEQLKIEGQKLPWGRLAKIEDIGKAAAFLASDAADYITGACLRVDGGFWFPK